MNQPFKPLSGPADAADARARGALLASLSHDLRAPLARILQCGVLLEPGAGAAVRLYQGAVEASARQQLELVDDLLEFSRLELAEPELVPAPAFIYALLEQAGLEGAALAQRQGGVFSLSCPDPLPALAVLDARRLRQALAKLLGHAARVSQRGRFGLLVRAGPLAAEDREATLTFGVSDSGAALAPADMRLLFEPFQGGAGGRAGAALGLGLAARLVAAMGGRLDAVNLDGGGVCFEFSLTVALAREADALAPMPAFAPPPPFGQGWSLLLLEAEGGGADYLSEVLGCAEFEVERAVSLDQALARPPAWRGRVLPPCCTNRPRRTPCWRCCAG